MSLRGSGSLKSRETALQYRRLRRLATIATWAFWSEFESAGKADLLVDYSALGNGKLKGVAASRRIGRICNEYRRQEGSEDGGLNRV
jgi:hypothetical protein